MFKYNYTVPYSKLVRVMRYSVFYNWRHNRLRLHEE